jgi:hypothetical protein
VMFCEDERKLSWMEGHETKSRGPFMFIYEAMAHLYYDICLIFLLDPSHGLIPFTRFSRLTTKRQMQKILLPH